jgi:HSP20 family protein
MRAIQRELNRMLNGASGAGEAFPPVNIRADAEKTIITAEVPGIDPADINIAVAGDHVTIEGEIKEAAAPEGAVWHRRERAAGKFSRALRLPYEADQAKVTARTLNGVLTLTLPRAEQSKPKKITVQSE